MRIDKNTIDAVGKWIVILAFLFAGIVAEFKGSGETAAGFFLCSLVSYFVTMVDW